MADKVTIEQDEKKNQKKNSGEHIHADIPTADRLRSETDETPDQTDAKTHHGQHNEEQKQRSAGNDADIRRDPGHSPGDDLSDGRNDGGHRNSGSRLHTSLHEILVMRRNKTTTTDKTPRPTK